MALRLEVLHLPPPGTALSGTPFGVRVLVGLGSGGTAARNPRLPSDTPPGSPGWVSGGFLACAADFHCHFQRLTDRKVCHHVVEQAFSLLALDDFGALHPRHRMV